MNAKGTGRFVLADEDLDDFTRGAALLATGGGGDPYIGKLLARAAIREFGAPEVINLEELADDALICIIAMLGAPTVLSEKACNGKDLDLAIQRMSERMGKKIDALIPAEIGGVNSTVPIAAAARTGLPLVNADGMGRAFPEIQMCSWNFGGVSPTPFVITDEHENSAIVETDDPTRAEQIVRAIAVEMGLSCMVAGYAMSGADAKRTSIANTLTTALEIGGAKAHETEAGEFVDPVEAQLRALRESPIYGHATEIFDGKIVDLQRGVSSGYSVGECAIEGLVDRSRKLEITFQNEYLIAIENGELKAIVPDLIMMVDRETADPIPVERLKYGQRVKVLVAAAPRELTTPEALKYISPRCFGLDQDYIPIQQLAD